MFYVANSFAILLQGGKKQNKTPFLAGIWVTVWEENVAKGLHCPTVWDLSDNLDWIYVHEASMPRCGALLRGLTYLHHSTTRGHTPAPGETLSGISRHGALDVFSTRHPRVPGPDRWKDNPVSCLGVVCLRALVSSCLRWKRKTLPSRNGNVKQDDLYRVFFRTYGNEIFFFTTSF